MRVSKLQWLFAFLLVLVVHILVFELILANKKSVSLEQNFGGFDYPIKDDVFESVIIVSDLPVGEFKQAAIDSVKAAESYPDLRSQDDPEISPVKDIKSDIEAVQKPKQNKEKSKEKIKKEPLKETKPDTKFNEKVANIDKSKPTQSDLAINSSAKDSFASTPISGTSTRIATNAQGGISHTDKQSWKALVISHLNKHKRYPNNALSKGEEGVVKVRVTITRDGEILSSTLSNSTKFQSLNVEAVEIFHRASPLPAPPNEYFNDSNELVINFPIEFNIKKYKQGLRQR